MENEASLGGKIPELGNMPMINKGSETPASDAVKQSGLQPQVDAQEIRTKSHEEQDETLAIDSEIEHMDANLPKGNKPKLNQFKQMWDQLKAAWEEIKMGDQSTPPEGGLGTDMGDPKYLQMMQQYPNMVPAQSQGPHGPGTFGQM